MILLFRISIGKIVSPVVLIIAGFLVNKIPSYILPIKGGSLLLVVTKKLIALYGETWSHDGLKVAYISNKGGHEGIYVVDLKTKKKSLIATGEYYIPVAWSSSDQEIMMHSKKFKNIETPFDEIDITNVITLK